MRTGCCKRFVPIFLLVCGYFDNSIAEIRYGFQSGLVANLGNTDPDTMPMNDDSFASSLYYDSQNGLLFVTGGTYSRFWDGVGSHGNKRETSHLGKSDCFLTILNVPRDDEGKSVNKEMKMVYARRFGKEKTPEACSAVSYVPSAGSITRAITIGNTEEGGLLTSLRNLGSRKASLYGFIMGFDIRIAREQEKVVDVSGKVEGGRLMYDVPVQYPLAVTSDPLATNTKEMYVALLASPINSKKGTQEVAHPDLTVVDNKTGYGEDFRVIIEMMEPKSQAILDYESEIGNFKKGAVREIFVSGWKRSFSPNMSSKSNNPPTLQVSDLVCVPRIINNFKGNVIVLTGTTNGHGTEFGGPEPTTGSLVDYGFVTKLSSSNGDIDLAKDGSVSTTRIGVAEASSSVKGICFQNGEADVEYIYAVGFTEGVLDDDLPPGYDPTTSLKDGTISKHAFLTKLKLTTLEEVWSRQIGSQDGEDIIGHGCDVSPNGSTVYLAGTVEDGGSVKHADDAINAKSKSSGGDDLFVASYSEAGTNNFIKQFGTSEDDVFARGKGIVCDENGNAIVLGNTRGSMMRLRGVVDEKFHDYKPNDIFVVSIGKEEGEMRQIAEKFPKMYQGNNQYSQDDDSTEDLFTVEVVAIIVSSVVMLLAIVYAICNMRKVASDGTKWDSNDRVMDYLDEFNDDDVELHVRHSATGGVHGIYDFESKSKTPPDEVAIAVEEQPKRPNSRMSHEDSTIALENALSIVDSNKAKLSSEQKAESNDEEAVGNYNAQTEPTSDLKEPKHQSNSITVDSNIS